MELTTRKFDETRRDRLATTRTIDGALAHTVGASETATGATDDGDRQQRVGSRDGGERRVEIMNATNIFDESSLVDDALRTRRLLNQ